MGPQRRKGTLWFLMVVFPYISQSGFLSYSCEVPNNMGSVLVKEIRIVAFSIFVREVQVGMQSIGTVCPALVFVVQMFLCQLVDEHSKVEYITLKNVCKTSVTLRWVIFFKTKLQQKDEKMFTLMRSSQKFHAINVGLHEWPYTCKLLRSLLLCGLLVHGFDPISLPLAFPTPVLCIFLLSSCAIFSEKEVLLQEACLSFLLLK